MNKSDCPCLHIISCILSLPGTPVHVERRLPTDRATFIERFSKINIQSYINASRAASLPLGSRDDPSRFMHSCRNKRHGCEYRSPCISSIRIHERASCPNSRKEAHLALKEREQRYAAKCSHQCQHCSRRLISEKELQYHMRLQHSTWQPRPCPEPVCNPKHIFQSLLNYNAHMRDFHIDWIPCACPFPGCNSPTFRSAKDQ